MEEGSEPDLPRERPWRNAAHRATSFQPFSSVSVSSVQSAVEMTQIYRLVVNAVSDSLSA